MAMCQLQDLIFEHEFTGSENELLADAGLSARERNKLKRDLKRKGSSVLQTQASLGAAKRSKADNQTPAQVPYLPQCDSLSILHWHWRLLDGC